VLPRRVQRHPQGALTAKRAALLGLAAALVAGVPAAVSAKPRVRITSVTSVPEPAPFVGLTPTLVGSISSRAANQRVVIQSARCGAGRREFRNFGATRTVPGGGWRFVGERPVATLHESAYLRARWNRATSNTVAVRLPLIPTMYLSGKVVVLNIRSWQRMTGRVVELQQRDSAGHWRPYRRGRLRKTGLASYEARIRVSVPGPAIRGYVPATSARPCHEPRPTDQFELSGRPAVSIDPSYGGPAGPRQLVLSGRIASGTPGELIFIYVKGCGPATSENHLSDNHPTTTAGGNWRWVYPDPRIDEPVELQAQWNNQYSRLLVIRTPLHARLRVRRRVARVSVNTSFSGQKMTGRAVQLQRKAGDGWARVSTGHFRRVRDHQYEARFRVRTRGLTLRAVIPASSAKRCYRATTTSGTRS